MSRQHCHDESDDNRGPICLEYNENLEPGACPDCGWGRGFHSHKPVAAAIQPAQSIQAIGAGADIPIADASATTAAGSAALVVSQVRELREAEKNIITTLSAVFKDEKKWETIAEETATQFIERIKRGLEACGSVVAIEQRYRVFRLVIDPAQIEVSSWVNKS